MKFHFYLGELLLPVPPAKIDTKIANQNKTIRLINGIEINHIQQPGLTQISFELLLPQMKYPFAVYDQGFKPAKFYLDYLEKAKKEGKRLSFKVMRDYNHALRQGSGVMENLATNMLVTIEEYSITEDSKNGPDLVVQLNLKQYREYMTATSLVQDNANNQAQVIASTKEREVLKEQPQTYTVVPGDTLWAICKKHLGAGEKYAEIARKNNIANPNLIYPGQVIRF